MSRSSQPARPRGGPTARRWRWLGALAAIAVALAAVGTLLALRPSEASTIEQVLSPASIAELGELRSRFGDGGDVAIALVERSDTPITDAELDRVEHGLAGAMGVARSLSARSRPRIAMAQGGGVRLVRDEDPSAKSELDRFFSPSDRTRIVVLELDQSTRSLEGAKRVARDLDAAAAHIEHGGLRVRVVGTPEIRAESWEVARGEAGRMLPILILAVTLVPLVFFRSLAAVLVPLVSAAVSTALTLLAFRIVERTVSPWALILVPIVWAVATMDTLHLIEEAEHLRARGERHAGARALKDILAPCAMTAATTGISLALLAAPGGGPLMRTLGLWGAAGTLIAFGVTFVVAPRLLDAFDARGALAKRPVAWARRIALASARHRGKVASSWVAIAGLGAWGAASLEVDTAYPHIFASETPVARAIRDLESATDSSLVPLEIYIEPTDAPREDAHRHVLAAMSLHRYLQTLPETRLVLSAGTLVNEWLDSDPKAWKLLARPDTKGAMKGSIRTMAADSTTRAWFHAPSGTLRMHVLFAECSHERRAEILSWIEHFDETMLSHHRIVVGGPAYFYHRAESEGIAGAWQGAIADILLLGLVFAWQLRRGRLALVALVANALPVVVLLGIMRAANATWTVALMGLPIVVLGLSVDDTIHLFWLARSRPDAPLAAFLRALARVARAVIGTALVVGASLSALSLSGFATNRALGWLVPLGLLLGLAAELSLLPALLALVTVRRTRPQRTARARS